MKAFHPFLDEYGYLLVGGWLRRASLSFTKKHPIFLHHSFPLTALIVRYIHKTPFHTTYSFVKARLQSVWRYVSSYQCIIPECVWCVQMKGQFLVRPFVGVDFGNHRSVKLLKYYASFFVCFTTRVTHIDTVSYLTTKVCIATLQRFSSRRGIPNTILSDNARNFKGLRNELEKYCQSSGITWKFIPPLSSYQGDIWESVVKAGKKFLVTVTRSMVVNAELQTMYPNTIRSTN